jgi:hypothetical protein
MLLPGAGSTRTAVLAQAAVLARHGYGAILVDTRGHGRSGGHAMDSAGGVIGTSLPPCRSWPASPASTRARSLCSGSPWAVSRPSPRPAPTRGSGPWSPANVQVWVAPRAGHTQGRATVPRAWEARVISFLNAALQPSPG